LSVKSSVHRIVSRLTGLPAEEITPKLRVLDYIDSPDAIEFIMELEEEFDVTIPAEMMDEMETVEQAIRFFEGRLGQGKGS
jgi:acyl carrier protein